MGRGLGVALGVTIGVGVAVGEAVGLALGVGVGVTVGVGVGGGPDCVQYLPPVSKWLMPSAPPQTIISPPVQIAV